MCLCNAVSRLIKLSCLTLFLTTSLASQAYAGSGKSKGWGKWGKQSNQTAEINEAPTIAGSPATSIEADSYYRFQPVAGDRDGNSLTFSIRNRPAWARFDSTTGRLAGSPTASDVGIYSDISISVSDGTKATSLPAFSLTVNDAAARAGTVTLSWVAPGSRADGTPLPLSELAGYTLYYGLVSGGYTDSIGIDDPYTTSLTVTELPAGTYYFAVTARNITGDESGYSEVVSKQVN